MRVAMEKHYPTTPDIDEIVQSFEPINRFTINADSRRRVTLSRLESPADRYRVYDREDGTIVMVPVMSLPIHNYNALVEQAQSTPDSDHNS
jgi:hypothetical protein